jgi:hypothetical protein
MIKIMAYHPESGSCTQISEAKVRMMISDAIANDGIDCSGDHPIAQPNDDIEYLIGVLNNIGNLVIRVVHENCFEDQQWMRSLKSQTEMHRGYLS